ncbi:MAG TPA: hypothetical protein EYO06_03565 [Candidatus Marinimicrobia bacterium]|nr:hypothetical protein [Candidatus Neomarinimicrobiota bacterium]
MTQEQWEKLKDIIEDPNKSGFLYNDEIVIYRDSNYPGAWNMDISSDPAWKIRLETVKEGSTEKNPPF